ncbi:MAG: DUF4422 domain-containing protein [Alphaproteobacteria bacterium]|nr:DUF4422 domain-containing protein [Alphaproteobacteria bacterium]
MTKQPNVKILVCYHKPAVLLKNDVLVPIHTGRALATEVSKDGTMSEDDYQWMLDNMIGDDTGDNISEKNRSYNEVTGIYWAWKNRKSLGNPEYVGFMHYRRQFLFDNSKQKLYADCPQDIFRAWYTIDCLKGKDFTYLFSEEQIKDALSDADVLVPETSECELSVSQLYASWTVGHVFSDLELALSIIDEKYPEYSNSAKEYMDSHRYYNYNMFVMKRGIFDSYCEFLFGILFEMEKRIDISDRSIVKLRTYAYISERLTGVFITQLKKNNNISIKERHLIFEKYTDVVKKVVPSFKKNNVPVVFCADENYFPYLCVAINSLICNGSSGNNYDIFVIVDSVKESSKRKLAEFVSEKGENVNITFIDVEPYLREVDKSIFYIHGYFSIAVYWRLFIPRILKNFDKVIYLDCDTVVLSDIADLYKENLGDNIIGGVKDVGIILGVQDGVPHYQDGLAYYTEKLKVKDINNYVCSGVLLLNLNKMRQENFEAKCIEKIIEMKTLSCPDQDVINSVCAGRIKILPMKWDLIWNYHPQHPDLMNLFPNKLCGEFLSSYKKPSIIHYCGGSKPLRAPNYPLAEHFWKYARQTPFYEEIIRKSILLDVQARQKAVFDYKKNCFRYFKYRIFAELSWGQKRIEYERKRRSYKEKVNETQKFLKEV